MTGVKRLGDVPFLHATPGVAPFIVNTPDLNFNAMPPATRLTGNYPNPFNPATRIEFTLRDPAVVSLTVYDVLGRVVATLIDRQPMEEGDQAATFDGSSLASGVYFTRLEVETAGTPVVEVGRMVLMK